MAQRCLVGSWAAAVQRAEATVNKAPQREAEAIETPRLHGHATRFETPEAAHAALDTLALAGRSHPGDADRLLAHKR